MPSRVKTTNYPKQITNDMVIRNGLHVTFQLKS
jgi:hypothetical protein